MKYLYKCVQCDNSTESDIYCRVGERTTEIPPCTLCSSFVWVRVWGRPSRFSLNFRRTPV